jgi:hypothetical protein
MNKSINQSINHGCRGGQYSVSILVRRYERWWRGVQDDGVDVGAMMPNMKARVRRGRYPRNGIRLEGKPNLGCYDRAVLARR